MRWANNFWFSDVVQDITSKFCALKCLKIQDLSYPYIFELCVYIFQKLSWGREPESEDGCISCDISCINCQTISLCVNICAVVMSQCFHNQQSIFHQLAVGPWDHLCYFTLHSLCTSERCFFMFST